MDDLSLGLLRLQRMLSSRRAFSILAAVADVPLSQQAVQVLRALGEDCARPVVDVARAAQMDVAAVSRQLRALEEGGLVQRAASPTHGSVVLVEATPRGRELARRVEAVRNRHLDEALASWSARERAELGRLLLRLVDDLHRTPYRADRPPASRHEGTP